MDEKLILRNVVEGCDEYELDLSKRIYIFSSLRDYKICNYVIDWIDELRRTSIITSYKMEWDEELVYTSDEAIITMNMEGKTTSRRKSIFDDVSLFNSYEFKYLGNGEIWSKEILGEYEVKQGFRTLDQKKSNVKDKYMYLRNFDSMKSPYDQMNQLNDVFRVLVENPTCKVFLSTCSPYIANFFNVNILRYYECLGDKFAYYVVCPSKEGSNKISLKLRNCTDDLDDFLGIETINLADTYELSEPMEIINDKFKEEEWNYKQRTKKF